MIKSLFYLGVLLLFSFSIFSQEESALTNYELYYRDYNFLFGFNYDVINSSENFRTILKIYSDAYYRGFKSKLENSQSKEAVEFTWTFIGKWLTFLLPHEFGHMLRTNHIGRSFIFTRFAPPVVVNLKLTTSSSYIRMHPERFPLPS